MFFTREDILKIQNALLQLSVKDSELPSAEPVTYDDTLSIVQNGKNKQIKIEDFFNQISLWKREDFINITDKYDEHYISLIEAIKLVPVLQRKDGIVITFQDIEGNWEIYQFRGNITEFFNIEKWFNLYDYRNNIIQSVVPDEEDLTASTPDENGNSLVSLKDRVYDPTSFSGKGYKILRKNIQTVDGKIKNILTSDMINQPNTIYEIRYDFTLGEDITIPVNCVLKFNGGSLEGDYTITNKADYIYYTKNNINNSEFNNLFKFAKKVIFYNDVSITEPINIIDKSEISISGDVVFLYRGIETTTSSGKAVLKFENCSNISIDGIKINGGSENGFISRPLPSEENYNQWITKRNNILPALMFDNCQHYNIENIQIEYCQVAIANLRSSNGYFNNIYIQHTYADGIMSIHATHDIAISNIHGYDIGDDFISVNNSYKENVDNTPYNIVASDCKVTDGKGALICFEGSRNVSIVNSIGLNMQFAPIKLGASITDGVYLAGENQSVINCVCTTASATTGNITTNGSNDIKSKNIKLVNVTVDSLNHVSDNPIRFLLHNIEGLFIDNLRVMKCNIHISNVSDLIIKNTYIENYDPLNLIDCTNLIIRDNIIKNIGAKYTASAQTALYISGSSNITVLCNRFTSLKPYDISFINVTNIDLDTNKISYSGSTQILANPYVNDNDDYTIFKEGQKIRVADTFYTLHNGKVTNANFMTANSSLNSKLLNQYNNGYIICDSGNDSGNVGLVFNIGGVLRAFDGETYNIRRRGTTSQRVSPMKSGFCYFDTTLGKPIWWTGTDWIDATGAIV